MLELDTIEKAVAALPEPDFDAFTRWFEELLEQRFDGRLARGIAEGRFDALAKAALEEHERGETREL